MHLLLLMHPPSKNLASLQSLQLHLKLNLFFSYLLDFKFFPTLLKRLFGFRLSNLLFFLFQSCLPMNDNVLALCVVADLGVQYCQSALNLNRSTKLQVCTSVRLMPNPCACSTTQIKYNYFL